MSSHQKHYLKINPYLDIISGIAVVLSFSDGIIKIIGREGSGKSVLTQLLAAELIEEDQEVVIFSDIPHSEQELHDPISQQLHLKLEPNSDFYEALNHHIKARPFDQQKLILVFDDADQIPEDCFAAIRHLFEMNCHERPEVSMVFAGTEMLDEKLNEPENRAFNKNIILNFEVKPMNRSELEAFCNAYLVEMGLQQKHRLSPDNIDEIFAETQGMPGKIPELIFAIFDREEEQKKNDQAGADDKKKISKLVVVDDDPEPEMVGLSVEDREEVLAAYKDQIPWRWQSNGVGIAVVVLFCVVGYGYFVPVEDRTDSIVIFPPPDNVPGQLSRDEVATVMAEVLAQQNDAALAENSASAPEPEQEPAIIVPEVADTAPVEEPAPAVVETPAVIAEQDETVEQAPAVVIEETPEAPAIAESLPEIEPETPAVTPQSVAPQPQIAQTTPEPEPDQSEPEPAITETPQVAITEPELPAVPSPAPAPQVTTASPITPVSSTPSPSVSASAVPVIAPGTFVRDWLQAWENQNPTEYLDAYHSGFIPPGTDLPAWQNDRRNRITEPENISINEESLEILGSGSTEATVRLQFTYTTPTYADRTVKELVLVAENGDWAIREERNVSVESLNTPSNSTQSTSQPAPVTVSSLSPPDATTSGFDARIRQVLNLVGTPTQQELNSPFGMFINQWLGAWKSQDVESYFRHYADEFEPTQFESMSAWRDDRIRKINEKRFIEIAFDDIEVLDETQGTARVRFWLSYASSFYLDRTLKEVIITTARNTRDLGIVQERNLEVEIIPFYP